MARFGCASSDTGPNLLNCLVLSADDQRTEVFISSPDPISGLIRHGAGLSPPLKHKGHGIFKIGRKLGVGASSGFSRRLRGADEPHLV